MRGLGCMRLSEVDAARAEATIHAALDAGVRFLDTADVYFGGGGAVGDNERLVARALASWSGDQSAVRVATKGGLVRQGARWTPDGRAKHLRAACERSLAALGVERIDLYQLHTPDPRTKLATSVRALAKLARDGLVERLGVCNVSLGQLREACDIAPIDAVQVALDPFHDDCLRNGVAEFCIAHDIQLVAHSPLGGPRGLRRVQRDAVLTEIASRLGASPEDVALAWLESLSPVVTPIPGATRVETAARVPITLGDGDLATLDTHFPASVILRVPRAERRPKPESDGDVVLVMGYPGAGKSTLAAPFVEDGYLRLNRDTRGGALSALAGHLDDALAEGTRRAVLDNTYGTRKSRNAIIETAWRHGVPVRCVWLDTSIEDAQRNAAERMFAKHGRLLEPDEIAAAGRSDPAIFGPDAQFRYRRDFEPPELDEGFEVIDRRAFERRHPDGRDARALIVECEALEPGRRDALERYRAAGGHVVGLAWLPDADAATVVRHAEAVRERIGAIEILTCTHPPGPPRCWCRKPLPGRGVVLIETYGLDPARCLHVGLGANDRLFAERLGFGYVDAATWDP